MRPNAQQFLMALWLASGCWLTAAAEPLDPQFRPELVAAELTSRQVRPGDRFALTLKFRNTGSRPASADYRVFVHFEAPGRTCANIVISADHVPTEPTTLWQPGQVIVDGPMVLTAPTDRPEQEYFIHVGLFDYGRTGQRLLETYDAGTIRIDAAAPPADRLAPKPLAPEAVAKRRQTLVQRIPSDARVSLQAPGWSFDLDRGSGAWLLTDKATGVLWGSDPALPRFGRVVLSDTERSVVWRVDRFDAVQQTVTGLRMTTKPLIDGQSAGVTVVFNVERTARPEGLRLSYKSQATGKWQVTGVRLIESAMTVTDADDGRFYVPYRLGIELDANQAFPGNQSWQTYANLSMAMCGAIKQGAALLVNWENVDTRLTVHSRWSDLPTVPGRRAYSLSLEIDAPSGSCTLHPLGRGGYVEIAHTYRALAEAKGWRRTWAEKRRQYPTVDRLFGAADFKPFVFSRVVPSSRFARDGKERTHLGFTFQEVADCAEHWRKDLGIDRAYVVLAGWINGGYDVRHPDVLPAAPECGGNEELARAIARIKACDYLVGMHDNYQDMYEDAPSWDLKWLNKNAAGVAKKGGNWNGGQAWQVCAIEQVKLAARPETNLPKIAALFGPTVYFIDTVFAWPLVTCEDPAHPMTRRDDLHWKTELCLLAKRHFGLFGSEEGREWSVPCADYLEGIFGHQTDSPPGSVIPLFPLVYSDCVQIMTHQGNRIGPGNEKKMADHILFAEMHLPRFGNHHYWTATELPSAQIVALEPLVRSLGKHKFEITYRWQTDQPLTEDYGVFVHFTHPAATDPAGIAYQNDHAPKLASSRWQPGTVVADGPYTISVPEQYAGRSEIWLGILRAGQRVRLTGRPHDGLRYHVGTISVTEKGVAFEPVVAQQPAELWSRADGGWGEDLCTIDRVIKNTWEVLSPLNQITAESPFDSHDFLSKDRLLQRTRFGSVTITVAYQKPATIGDHRVPAYGFIVESPRFVACCATRYNGLDYATPTLFTARSLDGKPIAASSKVRIYHGFGDPRIRLGTKVFSVPREEIVSVD